MIPLPRVAKILQRAADFVEQQLITEGLKAQWSVMDNFADILTSVEYYIERYSNSPMQADENLLQRAELALGNLPGQDAANAESVEAASVEIDSIDNIFVSNKVIVLNLSALPISNFSVFISPDIDFAGFFNK